MSHTAHHRRIILLLLGLIIQVGCTSVLPTDVARLFPSFQEPTRTPFQPVLPTQPPTPSPVPPTPTPEPVQIITAWLDPALPDGMRDALELPPGTQVTTVEAESNVQIGALRGEAQSTWVYVVAAAFPTLQQEIPLDELQRAWRGEAGDLFTGSLLLEPSTRAALAARWGEPSAVRISELSAPELLDAAWSQRDDLAIVPFDALEPRWKLLPVDGFSPLERNQDFSSYPLTVRFGISGSAEALQLLDQQMGGASLLPEGNYDPARLTTLVMTGVTALARATGYKMDTLGTTYPGRDIRDWLVLADITHISNEVSFNPDCPAPNYYDTDMQFCSRPHYLELLEYIGTDVVELSGNHNNDYGREASLYSLERYAELGWKVFAGGANLEDARRPALLEHNGNRFAFLGCNPAGPPNAWATDTLPGAAPCEDYGWLLEEIRRLRGEGYLPIVTLQYFEIYYERPSDHQERNFKALVDAGAVIVSGSHAHYPQSMAFHNGSFIHYGLGNLFFDQMDIPVVGTRREFIDQHTFYAGRHVQTELLTALLEDYSRPRPMTDDERAEFLTEMYSASDW